uniref:Uncharacterized protein n=1 Tax=Arundo donax TaxID=35708 RepID=A0A0A9CZ74_ARUDO
MSILFQFRTVARDSQYDRKLCDATYMYIYNSSNRISLSSVIY